MYSYSAACVADVEMKINIEFIYCNNFKRSFKWAMGEREKNELAE